jgi:ATP-dependent DNA helicase PIF1
MRLKNSNNSHEISQFSQWILKVGEGKLAEPNDGFAEIEIPKELLIVDYDEPIPAIVFSTYPNLVDNYKSHQFLQERAILASTIEVVDQINNYVLSLIPGIRYTTTTELFHHVDSVITNISSICR